MTVLAEPVVDVAATADEAPLLSVRNLRTYFGDVKKPADALKAVDGVSFDIKPGETFCCVGESGSGKSISALSVMQLVPRPPGFYAGGQILLRGEGGEPPVDLMQLGEREMRRIRGRRIGMIFQEPMTSLNPVYTIGDQIGEVLRLHLDMTGREARARTIELLEQVQIPRRQEHGRRVPAPVQRRHEAAGDDRDGDGVRAGAAHRR